MRTRLGVELSASWCSLVAAAPAAHGSLIQRFHTIDHGPGLEAELEASLRQALADRALPRRAHVVVWGARQAHGIFPLFLGLRRSGADAAAVRAARQTLAGFDEWAADAAAGVRILEEPRPPAERSPSIVQFAAIAQNDVRVRLRPLLRAGLEVEAVLTPPLALEALARTGRAGSPGAATAYLALNRDGGAVAVVENGRLQLGREMAWEYPPEPANAQWALLQRYSFVARLGSELRWIVDSLKSDRGIVVERIVTCGNLGNLRSLTMPLIEELDLEVETLDSMEGIDVAALPEPRERFRDLVGALRLALAAAVEAPSINLAPGDVRRRAHARALPIAAAGLLAASLGLVAVATWRDRSAAPPARPSDRVARPAVPMPGGGDRRAREDRQTESEADRQKEREATTRASTPDETGRDQVAPSAASATVARVGRPAPALSPRAVEEPVVSSILFSASRRLAVVDGRIVGVGDHVGEAEVVEIQPDAVRLRWPGGRDVRLTLGVRPQAGAAR